MSDSKRSRRVLEIVGLLLLLGAVPVALVGIILPTNEYSWMAATGTVPPDCDIITGDLLLPTALVFLGGLVGFGLVALRRRSRLRFIATSISAVMLLGITLKLPSYFSESAKASKLCSK